MVRISDPMVTSAMPRTTTQCSERCIRRIDLHPDRQRPSLANPGTIPLEQIEVQVGCYLGEDDIVRLTDQYGRS